ncbi:hypothetical protein [Tessaracoccus coleopterorum]|uniref:hypothetical protein n=1 Tax=Tessaracoccus coleopterorum TaxID=2714950 RepID=UPI0018D483DA|nr:hypothetical protein [Tessaracoccus coleopterorum]
MAVLISLALSRFGVSALLIAIVLGLVAGNVKPLPASLTPASASHPRDCSAPASSCSGSS